MSIGGWFAFTLFINAARTDADPEQLKRLRSEVIPAIQGLKRRDLTNDEVKRLLAIVLFKVQGIMGPTWEPDAEHMAWINSLTEKGK